MRRRQTRRPGCVSSRVRAVLHVDVDRTGRAGRINHLDASRVDRNECRRIRFRSAEPHAHPRREALAANDRPLPPRERPVCRIDADERMRIAVRQVRDIGVRSGPIRYVEQSARPACAIVGLPVDPFRSGRDASRRAGPRKAPE
jgi:hypothetical protein